MVSPDDFLEEEGERLIKQYLDVQKIAESKNPQQEFMKQFAEAFGTRQGINLLQEVERKKSLLDILYNKEIVQRAIRDVAEERVGKLKKKEQKKFWDERNRQVFEKQKELEKTIEKPFKEIRKGKTVLRPKPFNWKKNIKTGEKTKRYNNFLLRNKDLPAKKLAWEFNQLFATKQSHKSVKDHLARLLGKRKGEKILV